MPTCPLAPVTGTIFQMSAISMLPGCYLEYAVVREVVALR
jgi:hypothetical protein